MILVVAVNQLGIIGRDGDIPWYCPEDLKLFKRLTLDKVCLVGRKTYESLPPLKRRTFLVVGTGHMTLEDALAQNPDCVIGGQQIYEQTMHLCDELHISHIQNWEDGDTKFSIPDELVAKWALYKKSKGKKGLKEPKINHYYLTCPETDPVISVDLNQTFNQ